MQFESRDGKSVEEIQGMLLDFISATFIVDRVEIDINKSLVQTGVIDSIGLLEISAFIEKAFSLRVVEHDMTRENFGSVVQMARFVHRRLSPDPGRVDGRGPARETGA
jgi:acyl carrier protein